MALLLGMNFKAEESPVLSVSYSSYEDSDSVTRLWENRCTHVERIHIEGVEHFITISNTITRAFTEVYSTLVAMHVVSRRIHGKAIRKRPRRNMLYTCTDQHCKLEA